MGIYGKITKKGVFWLPVFCYELKVGKQLEWENFILKVTAKGLHTKNPADHLL